MSWHKGKSLGERFNELAEIRAARLAREAASAGTDKSGFVSTETRATMNLRTQLTGTATAEKGRFFIFRRGD